MKELVDLITIKHRNDGIEVRPPATLSEIVDFENKLGFKLPIDFKKILSDL